MDHRGPETNSPEEELGQQNPADPEKQKQNTIDGGSIRDLHSSYLRQPSGYSENQRDGRRRGWIALLLFLLLGVLILSHYAVIAVFAWNGKPDVKAIETAFNTALPVIAGLAGTAAAFYFKDRDRGR